MKYAFFLTLILLSLTAISQPPSRLSLKNCSDSTIIITIPRLGINDTLLPEQEHTLSIHRGITLNETYVLNCSGIMTAHQGKGTLELLPGHYGIEFSYSYEKQSWITVYSGKNN